MRCGLLAALLAWSANAATGFLVFGQAHTFRLQEATVQNINNAFDAGLLTSERLVQLYLNRIEAYDQQGPAINSIITVNPSALETARALDAERRASGPRSPLHGVPVLIKDNFDTFDMPTTAGSLSLRNSIPPDDAFIASRLKDAGAIILGKTNLDEFAANTMGVSSLGGQTRNPYDLTRIPGGSSGGSAAGIAAGFATVGFGTDTGGSVRGPSSLLSLVGLRPTMGMVSRDGIVPLSLWRDVAGPMGRSVSDVAVAMDVIAGFDPNDPVTEASQGVDLGMFHASLNANALNGARIGVVRDLLRFPSGEMRDIFTTALDDLRAAGAEIVDPVPLDPLPGIGATFYSSLEYDLNRYLETLGPSAPYQTLAEIIASGEYHHILDHPSYGAFRFLNGDLAPEMDPDYLQVISRREETHDRLLAAMEAETLDAIVYPSVGAVPPLIEDFNVAWDILTLHSLDIAAFLGWPAITVPGGFTSAGVPGIPLGIEFMGRPFDEQMLLDLAYGFERATHHRTPPPSTPAMPGEVIFASDFDSDGDVDGDDFLTWQAGFGLDDGGDADFDGDTDGDDFLIWQSQFGLSSGSVSAAVPEPACCALLLVLIAAVFTRGSVGRNDARH